MVLRVKNRLCVRVSLLLRDFTLVRPELDHTS